MIPASVASCHVAIIEGSGYFVVGHIPIEVMDKLLADRPDMDGIALPGMPPGSPGMGGVQTESLTIYAVSHGVASPIMVIDPQ